MKVVPDQLAPWLPGRLTSLGTDGFGRSENREHLRAVLRDFGGGDRAGDACGAGARRQDRRGARGGGGRGDGLRSGAERSGENVDVVRDSSRKEALAEAEKYLKAIKTALLSEWDPIGVKHFPEAQEEYDSYAPHIYTLLTTDRPQHELYDYLWRLETDHMGLTGNRQATERFAERLRRIPREIEES